MLYNKRYVTPYRIELYNSQQCGEMFVQRNVAEACPERQIWVSNNHGHLVDVGEQAEGPGRRPRAARAAPGTQEREQRHVMHARNATHANELAADDS